jgi:2'-hydroxyisoflavone reductase
VWQLRHGDARPRIENRLRVLVLGGTRFLGRHAVTQALAAGHEVTILNRGQSGPDLFGEDVEALLADRDRELPPLTRNRHWHLVIDTSAYFPRQVRRIASWLHGRVGRYQLVSSISAYANPQAPAGCDEALGTLARLSPDEPEPDIVTGANYGALKAACETAALESFGPQACVLVRPGLIVGPYDPTGRFTWWLERLRRGGEVLAPASASTPVQWIDARDLAAWLLAQGEAGTTGAFNLTGPTDPSEPQTYRTWLETLRETTSPNASFSWVDDGWALAAGVAPWIDWPLWLPEAMAGLHRTPITRARATGLNGRPLQSTVADTLAWLAERQGDGAPTPPGPPRPQAGLAAEREQALLARCLAGEGQPPEEQPLISAA